MENTFGINHPDSKCNILPNPYPTSYQPFQNLLGGAPPGLRQGQSVLIIDGAYLQISCRDLERQTSRKLNLSEESIGYLIKYIQEKTGCELSQRHFVTAEKDSQSIACRKNVYDSFKKNQISVDIRGFKKKQAWCPNKGCYHSQKAFDFQVQQEVDVAIVMKAMKIAFSNQLDQLILIAGDGDFKDMVEFFTETLYKKVWIFGYRASLSASLHEKASPNCVFYLDDIWDLVSAPNHRDQLSNSQEGSEFKKPIERIIQYPDLIDVPQVKPLNSSQSQDDSNSSVEEKEKLRLQLEQEQFLIKNEKNYQLLLKLGFDESLSKEALSKFPNDPQQAISFALNIKKMNQSQLLNQSALKD